MMLNHYIVLMYSGNNAMIVMDDADANMALRATLFSAVGTAGQRYAPLARICPLSLTYAYVCACL